MSDKKTNTKELARSASNSKINIQNLVTNCTLSRSESIANSIT